MNDEKNKDTSAEDASAVEDEPQTEIEEQEEAVSEEEQSLKVLDNLREENEELKDKELRTLADMENLRRRTSKEVQDARAYGVAGFAKAMLDVGDNLKRAIEAVPDAKRQEGSDEFKALIEGVEMTQKLMIQALEANGVKQLNPMGERFDPNFHQAMFEVPDEEKPNNSVAEVVQEGYTIGDRVLRPAMVGVAKTLVPTSGATINDEE